MPNNIIAEHTDNPHEVIFTVDVDLTDGESHIFAEAASAQDNPLARALFLVRGVSEVHIEKRLVRLIKEDGVIWPLVVPPAINIISSKLKKLAGAV